jgi:signal transduction histidine kinase
MEALQKADRNKDNFLATLAHEMLNPLSSSSVALQLLRATLTSASPDTVLALASLERQNTFLAALVEDLLDVARIRLGKVSLNLQDVVVQEWAKAAVEICQHRLVASAHDLRLVMPPSPVTVRADQRRLVQVLVNLLTNAAKFTPAGGAICIEVQPLSDAVEIAITDTGKGMTVEEIERAFELFHQNSDVDRMSGGLGIGLALVRQLVELQGGSVIARSPGATKGTTITVRLPKTAQPLPLANGRAPDTSGNHAAVTHSDRRPDSFAQP